MSPPRSRRPGKLMTRVQGGIAVHRAALRGLDATQEDVTAAQSHLSLAKHVCMLLRGARGSCVRVARRDLAVFCGLHESPDMR